MEAVNNNSNVVIKMDNVIDIANKVVSRYVYRMVIPAREKEDVVMAIVEKFLNHKDKIVEAFEGRSKITTYFVAVFNRMCCEVIRKESRHWYSIVEGESKMSESLYKTRPFETEKRFAISNELARLNNTMILFNGERPKLNLFLKFYFDLPISYSEIKDYSLLRADELKRMLEGADQKSKSELYETLSQVVNLVEGKNVKGDAVRMWMNKQIDIILTRLNFNGISNHNKDSLVVLLEMQQNQN